MSTKKTKPAPQKVEPASKKLKTSSGDVYERLKVREEFLRELRRANRIALTGKVSVKKIESVLRQNNCPKYVMRGKKPLSLFWDR